jgi:hypothetical protein
MWVATLEYLLSESLQKKFPHPWTLLYTMNLDLKICVIW